MASIGFRLSFVASNYRWLLWGQLGSSQNKGKNNEKEHMDIHRAEQGMGITEGKLGRSHREILKNILKRCSG
uniref:Uncharacterized protein n=1 Tax=Heterorhabditis bacteriophora TaxID=37862 RepID=A0A1I7XJ74_HETBA